MINNNEAWKNVRYSSQQLEFNNLAINNLLTDANCPWVTCVGFTFNFASTEL